MSQIDLLLNSLWHIHAALYCIAAIFFFKEFK